MGIEELAFTDVSFLDRLRKGNHADDHCDEHALWCLVNKCFHGRLYSLQEQWTRDNGLLLSMKTSSSRNILFIQQQCQHSDKNGVAMNCSISKQEHLAFSLINN